MKKEKLTKVVAGQAFGFLMAAGLLCINYSILKGSVTGSSVFFAVLVWCMFAAIVYGTGFFNQKRFLRLGRLDETSIKEAQKKAETLLAENRFWQLVTPILGVWWAYHPPQLYLELQRELENAWCLQSGKTDRYLKSV